MFAERTHLFQEVSKAACFGEQVISPASRFLKWQLKAELPLIRSSVLCSCHQWREYGHQHATHHICKGNSKRVIIHMAKIHVLTLGSRHMQNSTVNYGVN